MKNPIFLIALAAGAAAAFPATAADTLYVEKLAPEIGRRCNAGSLTIRASDLRDAIGASGTVTLAYQFDWGADAPSRIAEAAFADVGGDNEHALDQLQHLAQTWSDPGLIDAQHYLPLADGGVLIERLGGGGVPTAHHQGVLLAILTGSDDRFVFRCQPPVASNGMGSPVGVADVAGDQRAGAEGAARAVSHWSFTGDRDHLALPLDKKDHAEFAYVDDQEADEESYTVNATLGLVGPAAVWVQTSRAADSVGLAIEYAPVAFVQMERKGGRSVAAADEVNNLNLGLQVSGYLDWRQARTWIHYYSLSARYLTDDSLESEGWSASALITPDFHLPGQHAPLLFGPDDRARLSWLTSFVLDHASIDDPGQKAALASAPEYSRLGYDLFGELEWTLEEGAVSLSGNYRLRDSFDGDGNAQMFDAALAFEPNDHIKIGIEYERGENLDSFEFSEQWLLALGLRY